MIIFVIFLSLLHNLFAQDAPFGVYNGLDSTQIPELPVEQINALEISEPIVQKKQENITYCSDCWQPYNNGAGHLGVEISEKDLKYYVLLPLKHLNCYPFRSSVVIRNGYTFVTSVI